MKYATKKDFDQANAFGLGDSNEAYAQFFIGQSANPTSKIQERLLMVSWPSTMLLLNLLVATTGMSTKQLRAVGRSSSVPPVKAGTRKKARILSNSRKVLWLSFRPLLSTGMEPRLTLGSATLPSVFLAKIRKMSGWKKFQTATTKPSANLKNKGDCYDH